MKLGYIQRIMGLLLILLSLTMLPPMAIALLYPAEGGLWPFIDAATALLVLGVLVWFPVRRAQRDLRVRDGFLVVALFWLVLGLASAVPLVLATNPVMSITDAVFEAVSGLTTTGATVLTGLEELPHSILWYRAQLHWLGGMGIIVLAVAILPMLGVGGMQLYRAETPGPVKDSKLTPRIKQTAKALWFIYLGLTLLCALAYWLAGMSLFDAVTHAFSTMATGGFSNYDASIAHFDSALIEWITVLFMVLAGTNFSLHFMAWRSASPGSYWLDPEFRAYLLVMLGVAAGITLYLLYRSTFSDASTGIRTTAFQTVSVMTSTGYTTTNFSLWPSFVPVLLIFISFMGGCGGSTAGGMKVIRFYLIFKQGAREIVRLIHPNAELPVKMGKRPVSDRVVEAVWGYFAAYVVLFVIMMLILMATGLDQVTAFSAIATCLNNLGPGLGDVASNFQVVSDLGKWVSVFAMLLGRLEIFTLLVLLTPAFWRH